MSGKLAHGPHPGLLAEAGFRDGGPEIDFYTAVGRYTSDRQVAEAAAQMLRQVGFRVRLHTPEYANFWADVRRGKTPMYYMGRGTIFDASDAAGQLYGTGGSPRGISAGRLPVTVSLRELDAS